ncbi:hypothetical protein [Roseovarius sp. Pro17]|uniref:hypothetical protein n=1 Tax=Roseovarius sp. Pro17 TaxID=3108175 RepID=UPI002D7696C6|nr:hypothetical protein [Roseovarius sp. Pro17]
MNFRILAKLIAFLGTLTVPLVGHAQSISLEDLTAQIDARTTEQNGFQALLTDPDPARAAAAMEIMMGSGDPVLQRMAMEEGIFSTNPSSRADALKAFFNSGPTLSVFVSLTDALDERQQTWAKSQLSNLGGSVDENNIAYLSLRIGAFDAAQDCYVNAEQPKLCLLRINDQVVSLLLLRFWNPMTLNDAGELEGTATLYASYPALPMRAPVTF